MAGSPRQQNSATAKRLFSCAFLLARLILQPCILSETETQGRGSLGFVWAKEKAWTKPHRLVLQGFSRAGITLVILERQKKVQIAVTFLAEPLPFRRAHNQRLLAARRRLIRVSFDKTPSAPESALNEDCFGSMGKRLKPVLQERFIGYPVPSAPSPNMNAPVRCGTGRKQIVGWPLGGDVMSGGGPKRAHAASRHS
jgi:hypothetical protein